MKNKKIRILTLTAMLVALSLVLDLVSLKTNTSKYSIYALPLLLSGMLFGPLVGALTGLVEGFICQTLTYGLTPTTILWIIAPIMWGLMSGLISRIFKNKLSIFKISINVIITSLIVLIINTLALIIDGYIYHYSTAFVYANLSVRIITSLVIDIFYIFVIISVVSTLNKIKLPNNKVVIKETKNNNETEIEIKK